MNIFLLLSTSVMFLTLWFGTYGEYESTPYLMDNHQSTYISVCSMSDRLAHLRASCPAEKDSMESWLSGMSLPQLKRMLSGWIVDKQHKVMACLHHKVGSSAWNQIFCNNSKPQPLSTDYRTKDGWQACFPSHQVYGMKNDKKFSKEEIIDMFRTYYKFMVVRHPLDRLVSFYYDKLNDRNLWYTRHLGSKMLAKYRPELSKDEIKAGKGVSFPEVIKYINDGNFDFHWKGPYDLQCHPCRVDFDAIVKLETFDHHAPDIIKEQLRGRNAEQKKSNSHRKSSWSDYQKVLTEYHNVESDQMEKLVHHYMLDFKQFGYTYSTSSDGVEIKCGLKTKQGHECC